MKKVISVLVSFVLIMSILVFASPNVHASEFTYRSENLKMIIDTDEKSEYIVKIDGKEIRYIETVIIIDEETREIETKAYDEETGDVLQHFSTKVKNDKIIEQNLIDFKDLSQQEDSFIKNDDLISTTPYVNPFTAFSNYTTTNQSLVTITGVSYTTNHTTNIGYADYARLKTRSVNLSTASAKDRSAYNYYTQNVDSLRATENGTIAGWLISAFGGGGLAIGTLVSWKTAEVILKNIAGPVAIAANSWALIQWFYYYNNCINGFSDLPK
ncbi:hypothetical protein P9B03_18995 [Metasolibacillus meyeri]|uniref:Uncharacterized protein n=1 Tax=Metasolibacillus meyeri TaxID=1071052 RepID=A0AAW9NVG7_9BACL|nr:hypothetical protein [Metasolibacillus meyeri]MEC1180552.1 hypothetical protein [Metasolibacillus meyeri]